MNVHLMEFYDEYDKTKTIEALKEFTALTFLQDGTDKLFIGCVLILITSVYRTRVTAEALATVINAIKKEVGSSNLLKFYLERVNGNKLVSKYLFKVIYDERVCDYAEVILDYLSNMSFDFCENISLGYKEKIDEFEKKEVE